MNNCWISNDLSYSVFHFIYVKIYIIFVLLTDFKCGYGIIKSNNSVQRQLAEKEISHASLEIKSTSTIITVNNSSNTVGNETTYPLILWLSKLNTTITGFYIFAGLSAAIILYFIIKALRLRRRRSKVRRYGILASREDVEMTPLGDEDEDEDSTVFDINEHSRS